MALIVVLWFLFSSSFAYHVKGKDNLTVTMDMKTWCEAGDEGFKTVNIIWIPPNSPESTSSVESRSYSVFFTTDIWRKTEYQFGCSLNTTQQSLQQGQLQCSISCEGALFPLNFYFILKMTNSSGSYVTGKKSCRLLGTVHCTKPQNFKVMESGKRNLTLTWEPAPHMGKQTSSLCYRIWYGSAQAKSNESVDIKMELSLAKTELSRAHTFHDLLPYTQYRFFIQCSLRFCLSGWGALSGPLTGMTNEEVPVKAPEFENWSVANIAQDKRDVTVVWKLPPRNTWNGIPREFQIDFWQVLSENGSSTPIPNSNRNLQIKNGSVTTATLPALNRFTDYQSQISMCTTQGCGPESSPWFLKGDTKPPNPVPHGESNNNLNIWIIVGTITGIFVVIVVIVIAWTRRRQRRKNRRPLEECVQVGPPSGYDEIHDSSMSKQNSYAEIRL